MTKSEIFKAAHKLARKVVSVVGDYMCAFKYSLEEVRKSAKFKNEFSGQFPEVDIKDAIEFAKSEYEKRKLAPGYCSGAALDAYPQVLNMIERKYCDGKIDDRDAALVAGSALHAATCMAAV